VTVAVAVDTMSSAVLRIFTFVIGALPVSTETPKTVAPYDELPSDM
jgi:hypothetical protein